jgi:hypothetical protein
MSKDFLERFHAGVSTVNRPAMLGMKLSEDPKFTTYDPTI